jgi:hypothetical protein
MANDPSEKEPSAVPPGGTAEATPPKPAAAAPPKAPTPAPVKETPPKPIPLENELVNRMKERFGEAIPEAWLDRKQAIIVVAAAKLREVALYCRDEEKFDMLTDLTAVDWPKREKQFDVILNLYSFTSARPMTCSGSSSKAIPTCGASCCRRNGRDTRCAKITTF